METVRIESTRKNQVSLPPLVGAPDAKGNTKIIGSGHAVEPEGVTVLPKDYWDAVSKRPDVQSLLKDEGEGRLAVVTGTGPVRAAPDTLEGLTEEQAMVHINACSDPDTLIRWCALQSNRTLLDCLETRLNIVESEQKRGKGKPAVVGGESAGGKAA